MSSDDRVIDTKKTFAYRFGWRPKHQGEVDWGPSQPFERRAIDVDAARLRAAGAI